MNITELTYKRVKGEELTMEERVSLLEYDIASIRMMLNKSEPISEGKNLNITISKVKYIYFVKDYTYRDTIFKQYLVTLEDDSKYYMDKIKGSEVQIDEGDTISFRVDGDKLREVRVLYNV